MEMHLRLGAAVYRTDSQQPGQGSPRHEHAGTLSRVLVDQTGAVEEIVVRLDAGLGLDEILADAPEVSIPFERIEQATEQRVLVRATAEELDELPEYVEERAPNHGDRWTAPPGYTLSDLLARLSLLLGGGAGVPPRVAELEKAAGEHQIVRHTPALVGEARIGEVTRVLYDGASGRVRALVLRRGHDGPEWLLPAEQVEAVADDAVQVRLGAGGLEGLERYRA